MSAIALFKGAKEFAVASKTLNSGAVTVGAVSRKVYGEKHGVKGSALKKAHAQYLREFGLQANGNVASMLTSGQWAVQSATLAANGDGLTVKLKSASSLGFDDSPEAMAAKLSDAELLAILAARKQAAPAAQEQPTA